MIHADETGAPSFFDEVEVDSGNLDALIEQCKKGLQEYPGDRGYSYRLEMLKKAKQGQTRVAPLSAWSFSIRSE